jgi:hypothetical protein
MPAPTHIGLTFDGDRPGPPWKPWAVGTGRVECAEGTLRCDLGPTSNQQYSDAQITDYQGLPRREFPWRPPLRLTVRAWAAQDLKGTAGFGFWNEPFVPVGRNRPHLPQAVWFFHASPPNNMALAKDVPGWGWKAATLDATRGSFLALAPLAPLSFLLMRIPPIYRRWWPIGQRAAGISEAVLPVSLAEPHTYELDWQPERVLFRVDGDLAHTARHAPRGPLGFIAWIDNQYAVVTPQGHFKFGLIASAERQWLALDHIDIQQGDSYGKTV